MSWSSPDVPSYVRNLSMEATFRSYKDSNEFFYVYVTYNKAELSGPGLDKIRTYNIQASGRIPISENEMIGLKLFTDKKDNMSEFSVMYRRRYDGNTNILSRTKTEIPISRLSIQTEIGPRTELPEILIEVYNTKNELIYRNPVSQKRAFASYESAINAVFMQVERISNPLIGAQYWLSPTQIFPGRVIKLAELKEKFRLQTSLSVIARAINLKIYEQISSEMLVDDAIFWKFVDEQLHAIKNAEDKLGGGLEIEKLDYLSGFSALPFLFFVPEHSEFDSRVYNSSGTELKGEIQILGVASERKLGINFTRPLSANEGYWNKERGEASGIMDSFITETAMPNERILGWIKYDDKLEFEVLRITYDEVSIKKDDFLLKNVKKSAKATRLDSGIIQLQRKDLAMDGLVAFSCKYSMIPAFEKVTIFRLDFMKDESIVQAADLKTEIIRPILRMPQEAGNFELVQPPESVSRLLVAHYPQKYAWTEEEKPEKVFISNIGSAEAKDVRLLAMSSNPDINVNLKISNRIHETSGFFNETEEIPDITVEISGVGESTIYYVVEYSDEMGNHYKDVLKEETVVKESSQPKIISKSIPLAFPVPISA